MSQSAWSAMNWRIGSARCMRRLSHTSTIGPPSWMCALTPGTGCTSSSSPTRRAWCRRVAGRGADEPASAVAARPGVGHGVRCLARGAGPRLGVPVRLHPTIRQDRHGQDARQARAVRCAPGARGRSPRRGEAAHQHGRRRPHDGDRRGQAVRSAPRGATDARVEDPLCSPLRSGGHGRRVRPRTRHAANRRIADTTVTGRSLVARAAHQSTATVGVRPGKFGGRACGRSVPRTRPARYPVRVSSTSTQSSLCPLTTMSHLPGSE